jgi:hypothetical protein
MVNLNFSERIDQVPNTESTTDSITSLLDKLAQIPKITEDSITYFRGHAACGFELAPSIYRNQKLIQQEATIMKEFLIRCPTDFEHCKSTFEKLVKMQHYSLPTRLLDITSNPLVALYFACSSENKAAGELLIFQIPKNEVFYFDSDTVSVISNISMRPSDFKIPDINSIDEFNHSDEIQFLLHQIKAEKPYFLPKIKKEHLSSVICIKPKLDNPRIIRQDGAFFLFGIKDKKENLAPFPPKYLTTQVGKRIIIAAKDKSKILRQLDILGINEATIYPEIDKVASHLKEKYSF